ncbi:hypothetical protein HYH02_013415 [Chlamydomonas schloesseri]|uniref:V-SNARE coiled-coil homology domain-containing protein n=1 Tax=Chlamydomonas schloesseri TaxID=2026947 RepID=A0A835SZW3_9CHLO|nr:hypothetical protein HYH02_013415 [Chlamydomonas schloesseri]|eukprot:KAG2431284.1 hypothetical protein HYH02_013415 [Chlamydomonas schloesseri]
MFGLGKPKTRAEAAPDRLRAESVSHELKASIGIPGTADGLAYEPVQGAIAVSTSDGKVKIFGAPGVERTVYSHARYPYATRQLMWLRNRGVLLRVSKGGFMECWSVAAGSRSHGGVRSLGSVKVKHDKICCVADMARDPYVLMGCASGGLRIAQLVDAAGAATSQPRAVRKLAVAPYRVRREELGGEGEVRQLAVQSLGPVHRALVLFTAGMVAVWDLRAAQLVCCLNPTSKDAAAAYPALAAAGEASAVCWVGTRHGDFATGHVDGSVLLWGLPGLELGEPELHAALRVVAGAAEPIRMLRCAYGEVEGLLVVGGGEPEQPEGLALLPLPEPAKQEDEDEGDEDDEEDEDEEQLVDEEDDDDEAAARRARRRRRAAAKRQAQGRKDKAPSPLKLPWFGHLIGFTLVSQGGAVTGYEDPVAVLQLVEGGQLVLFDLAAKAPANMTPLFQQRTGVSVTEAALVPVRRPSGSPPTAISLSGLRKVAAAAEAEDESLRDPSGGLGAFEAGVPPPLPADASWGLVYCAGYKDGGVCLWDLHGGTSRLLASAPLGDAADPSVFAAAAASTAADPSSNSAAAGGAGGGGSPGSVTAVSLVWSTGLVLAGHHRGELRVYQFSGSDRTADCLVLDSVNTPGTAMSLWQPAGLQLRLRVRVSSGEITSLAYCQSIRSIAVGDKSGGVALVDTGRPVVRWYAMPCSGAALAVALAPLPLPPPKARLPELAGAGEEGAPSPTVVVADAEGCLAALDAARGCFVGKGGELRPKNHSYSLCLELLDESYSPLWSRQQLGAGCSQAALGSGTPGGEGPSAGRRSLGGREAEPGRGSGGEEDEDEDEDEGAELEGDEDMDVDALLAKAAAHVDGSGHGKRSTHSSVRGSRHGAKSGTRRGGGGHAEEAEDTSGSVLSSCPDPTGHHVLLVTDQYLRLYSAANVMSGDRSVAAKRHVAPGQQLVYARPVAAGGGAAPGVMALAAAEHGLCVQVYSLPSLELVHEAPLSGCLSWYWDVPPGHERRLGRLAATSRLGQLHLMGLGNELLQMGVLAGLPPPALPSGLFSAEAAAASLEAAAEYEATHMVTMGRLSREPSAPVPDSRATESGPSTLIEGMDSPTARTEGRRVDKGPAAAVMVAEKTALVAGKAKEAAKEANVTLTKVFNKVQQGLTRAVEETTKGVKTLATGVAGGVAQVQQALIDGSGGMAAEQPGGSGAALGTAGSAGGRKVPPAAGGGRGGGGRSAEWYASLPDLGIVFSRTVPDDDAELARMRRKARKPAGGGSDEEGARQAGGGGGVDEAEEEDDDDISLLSITDDEDSSSPARPRGPGRRAAAAPAPQPARRPAAPAPAYGGAGARSSGGDEESMRADLFGGARPYTSAGGGGAGAGAGSRASAAAASSTAAMSAPRHRTADEIKRAYGRPTNTTARANDVREVMEQNRNKLAERGEKLNRLNDKAADLEASAQGFADMARQLAERERNKKWWQL